MVEHKIDPVALPSLLSEDNVKPVKKTLLSIYKLVYHKVRLEQRLIEHKQIQHNIQIRCTNYDKDLTKMIDSILNREKRTIVLDRLVYTDPVHGKVLITDAQTIKERAATHFQQYALPLTAPPPMNERWSEQFASKSYIDPNWYQALMVPPTWDEWIVNLQSLPNDKASGPSKLHNKFYKHACISVKKLTWELAKMCFQQSVIPDEWKQAYIYPIPKPTEWQCDITKTRPLTLLDTMRKAVMKIMTNRLS